MSYLTPAGHVRSEVGDRFGPTLPRTTRPPAMNVDDLPAADPKAIERYRKAVVKTAKKAGVDVEPPDPEILEAAHRRRKDQRDDCERLKSQFQAVRDIADGEKEGKAADKITRRPAPRGAKLAELETVADLIEAQQAYIEAKGRWDYQNPGPEARAAANAKIRTARQLLLSTADPALLREIVRLRRVRNQMHQRVAHHALVLGEVEEIQKLETKLDQWGRGQLTPSEKHTARKTSADVLGDLLIPGHRQRRDKAVDAANHRRVEQLYAEGKRRLAFLKSRAALHQRAAGETEEALGKIRTADTRIRKLEADRLLPQNAAWNT